MDSADRAKLEELMAWLLQDFKTWKVEEEQRAAESKDSPTAWELWQINTVITEKDYCAKRLGVPYESFNRWKNGHSPISPINILRIAINLRNTKPLEIFGFDPVAPDLWDILIELPRTSDTDRAVIRRILDGSIGEDTLQNLQPNYVTTGD